VPRRAGAGIAIGAALCLAVLLSGCSQQDALGLARQACGHVSRSIHLYDDALSATTRSAAERELQEANNQLQVAEPLAAAATSDNGQWNALMTTLQEIGRVDEGHLLIALRAQCSAAESNSGVIPPTPTTFPPVPSSTS
jgi:hypothetical protein